MTHHSELLNRLIAAHGYKSYLEIGTFNRSHNFDKINAEIKECVDPDPVANATYQCTSDYFFETINNLDAEDGGGQTFDLIFVDGLHHAEQVEKDIKNAYAALTPRGMIVVHDSNPPTEQTTCVPRGSQREWCGDVYKAISRIVSPKLTLDFDYGCCVILKSFDLKFSDRSVDWKTFDANRRDLLGLATVDDGSRQLGI
ncbi:MAG TPA: class I SAM-dependent methyltransferase [Chitinophagaceae bacterium]|nr:class I SAM-dependent methyltransferase [Chitinophagaceae bacterium]